jgi:predicted amidohydrolase YtcJ
MTRHILSTVSILVMISPIFAAAPAEMVIDNARIWSDGRVSFAEFAAVDDGRFVYVGERDEAYIDAGTQRIDARRRIVLPGLIDAHLHMLSGGRGLSQLQLREARDREDFIARIAEWAERLAPGRWILGGRWSTESWDDPQQPTKEWVDGVTGDHPLFVSRMDGHSALVNSIALRLAGIDANGPADPEGGVIDRDPITGEPTGILRESAMGLVSRHIPVPTIDERVESLIAAMREVNRHGITAVGDIPGIGELPVYERLAPEETTVRLYLYPIASDWRGAVARVRAFPNRAHWVQINGLKTFVDGTLGSRTAYMREPFLGNEPGEEQWRGLLREDVLGGRLERNIAAGSEARLQATAHCIGDEANHIYLSALEKRYADLARGRCRSEHAQHLLPEDIARFAHLGVIASMQPYHKADDGRYAESYIGPERCRSSYAFGSDWPVVTCDPLLGMEAAVTGRTLAGNVFQPQENLTVAEALRCYTSRAAYALCAEDEIGRIAPGYRADFVILNESPFGNDVGWSRIRAVAVYVEGVIVFDEASLGAPLETDLRTGD